MFSGKNKLPLILAALLLLMAIASATFAILIVRGSNELRSLQIQAASIENNRNVTRALANDAIEYSKRNPAIDPILQSLGLKPTPASQKPAK
jgi:hypothetical protein